MIALVLLGLAAVLMTGGARLRHVRLFDVLPRLGVFAWQAVSFTALLSVALAGSTLIVSSRDLGPGLAAFLRACVYTLQAAYATPTQFPSVVAGAVLIVAATLWPAAWVGAQLLAARRGRRRACDALALVGREDVSLGVTLVEADIAAAYCLPGRRGGVVLTTAAVHALDHHELAAVMAHERAHLRERHHLVVAAASGLARAFKGVPLFSTAAREMARLVELRADDAAVRDTDQVTVAAAIVALGGMQAPQAALAAAETAAVARVTRLLQPVTTVGLAGPLIVVSALALVAMAPALLTAYPAVAAAGAQICTLPTLAA